MTINFVRPVFEKTGKLRCEGKIIHAGGTHRHGRGPRLGSGGHAAGPWLRNVHGDGCIRPCVLTAASANQVREDMQRPSSSPVPSPALPLWLLILIVGTIVGLSMGRTQSMGLYLPHVTKALDIGREPFGLAMALAQLTMGIGAPFSGGLIDKFGAGRIIVLCVLCAIAGLYFMYTASLGPRSAGQRRAAGNRRQRHRRHLSGRNHRPSGTTRQATLGHRFDRHGGRHRRASCRCR